MEAYIYQRKSLVLTLLRQRQHFARVNIIMMMVVVCLGMEKKYLSSKLIMEMSTF